MNSLIYKSPMPTGFCPLSNYCLSGVVNRNLGPLVDPMSATAAKVKLSSQKQTLLQEGFSGRSVESIQFQSPRGAMLDGVKFSTQESSAREVNERIAILYCVGREKSFEAAVKPCDTVVSMVEFMQRKIPEADVFIVNPEGVGESEGTVSYDSGSLSYYGSIKMIQNLGYRAIAVHGFSLGGWRSLEAASLFSKENPEFPLCVVSDRSFGNFASLASLLVVGEGYMGGILKSCFRWGNLSKDVTPFLRSLGDKAITVFGDGDTVIPKGERLPASSTSFNLADIKTANEHDRPYTPEEEENIGNAIRARLQLAKRV